MESTVKTQANIFESAISMFGLEIVQDIVIESAINIVVENSDKDKHNVRTDAAKEVSKCLIQNIFNNIQKM